MSGNVNPLAGTANLLDELDSTFPFSLIILYKYESLAVNFHVLPE